MKKLFALDIDGTLLNNEGNIMPKTKAALAKLRDEGHYIMLITGRHWSIVESVVDQLPFTPVVVSNNGSCAIEWETRSRYVRATIPENAADYIFKIAKENNRVAVVHGVHRYFLFDFRSDSDKNQKIIEDKHFNENDYIAKPEEFKTVKNEGILQMSVLGSRDFVYEQKSELPKDMIDSAEWVIASNRYLIANKKGSSKWNTINEFAQSFGIDIHNIYTFGDSLNDFLMVSEPDNGVAMGNAVEELKEVASEVTDTNNNEGIYKYLLKKNLI